MRYPAVFMLVGLTLVSTACDPPPPPQQQQQQQQQQPVEAEPSTPRSAPLASPPEKPDPNTQANASVLPPPKPPAVENFEPGELQIVRITPGQGSPPAVGTSVTVNFKLSLPNGQAVAEDSTELVLGSDATLPGIEQALLDMKPGEKVRATIPSPLAFGQRGLLANDGSYLVPPGASVVVDLELSEVSP